MLLFYWYTIISIYFAIWSNFWPLKKLYHLSQDVKEDLNFYIFDIWNNVLNCIWKTEFFWSLRSKLIILKFVLLSANYILYQRKQNYFEAPVVDKIECYLFRRLELIGRNPKCDHDRRKKIEKTLKRKSPNRTWKVYERKKKYFLRPRYKIVVKNLVLYYAQHIT